MSEIQRIAGVFFEPTKTFEDVAARPTWVAPLLLSSAFVLVYMVLFSQHVGWDRFMRQQMENNPRTQQMTVQEREQAFAMQAKMAPFMGYAAAVGVLIAIPIYNLIASAVLLGIVAGIMSAKVRLKQIFAVMCYAGLTALVSVPLTLAVMFLKNPDDFNMQNPLMFNPGAFMDPVNSSKFLYSLASSLDLFVFWVIFLIAIGLKAAGGKHLSFSAALFSVLVPWGIYVLGKSAMAGMFS